jgi:hypothetical protein
MRTLPMSDDTHKTVGSLDKRSFRQAEVIPGCPLRISDDAQTVIREMHIHSCLILDHLDGSAGLLYNASTYNVGHH